MTTPSLAKIDRVDLRQAWPNEAQDFTPWLAENIAELGEALGMDLELRQTEAPVGGYSLDILATDLNQNRPVIIENQLEPTNHTHLGQLLTYAAGYDANVIVWLTREFRDEHRQALDWLNQRTDENTQFFGVVVELWRIDNSLPAPHFNLIATPNDWRKETVKTVGGPYPVSERSEKYKAFFQVLIDNLREEHKFTRAQKALPQNFYIFTTGHGGFRYWASFIENRQVRIDLRIEFGERERNLAILANLEQSKEQIEHEFGQPFEWDQMAGYRSCRIAAIRQGSIDDSASALSEIQDWMVKNLLKFRQVFGPRLTEIIEQ